MALLSMLITIATTTSLYRKCKEDLPSASQRFQKQEDNEKTMVFQHRLLLWIVLQCKLVGTVKAFVQKKACCKPAPTTKIFFLLFGKISFATHFLPAPTIFALSADLKWRVIHSEVNSNWTEKAFERSNLAFSALDLTRIFSFHFVYTCEWATPPQHNRTGAKRVWRMKSSFQNFWTDLMYNISVLWFCKTGNKDHWTGTKQ